MAIMDLLAMLVQLALAVEQDVWFVRTAGAYSEIEMMGCCDVE